MYDPSPPCQAYWRAEAVFAGTVTEVVYSPVFQSGSGDERWNYRRRIARIRVETPFKGVAPDARQVEVVAVEQLPTPFVSADGQQLTRLTSKTDCDYLFKQGERYLVYAGRNPKNDGTYAVSLNRTRLLADATEDLEYIRGLVRAPVGAKIYGKVMRRDQTLERDRQPADTPVEGVKITVSGGEQPLETLTEADGRYQIEGLAEGSYRVEATMPDHLSPEGAAHTAQVVARGCAEINFHTQVDGRISGRVLDPDGGPISDIRIDLALAGRDDDPRPQNLWAVADEDGRYELKGVPPGRYVLGFRLDGIGGQEHPFPRTYYPGVAEPSEAEVIELKEGEKLSDYDLTLLPRLEERTIGGIVVWPDGRPVSNASVILKMTEHTAYADSGGGVTDAEGRFTIRALGGLKYWIKAVVNLQTPSGGQRHSEPQDVPAGGDAVELKLVVTEANGSCARCIVRESGPQKKKP